MRPWLVVVGVVFLTLGAGSVAALYFGGQGTITTTRVPPLSFALGSNASDTLTLEGENGSSEQFHLSWHSSVPINVVLESPQGCAGPSGPCWPTTTLASWPDSPSGGWNGSGPFHYPLLCLMLNHHSTAANVSITGAASAQTPFHENLAFEVILGASAAALFVVGGLAVFLGVFLAEDPYGPSPSLVSQSAEDVEELTRDPDPPH